jgi:hypothetical protein
VLEGCPSPEFGERQILILCKDLIEIMLIKAIIKDSRQKFNRKIIRIHIKLLKTQIPQK